MDLAKKGSHKQLMIDTAEKSYSPQYLMKYRTAYPIIGLVGKPKNYNRFLINAQAILGFDATSELDRINCPTLIIGGEEDKIVGADASRELYAAIINSEIYIYPGLGHAAYEEARDFNRRVFEFLEKGNSQLRD
jgi:pimeloyl-ACP methyl ester carboxylesterase